MRGDGVFLIDLSLLNEENLSQKPLQIPGTYWPYPGTYEPS